jgi:hypothetical protein
MPAKPLSHRLLQLADHDRIRGKQELKPMWSRRSIGAMATARSDSSLSQDPLPTVAGTAMATAVQSTARWYRSPEDAHLARG